MKNLFLIILILLGFSYGFYRNFPVKTISEFKIQQILPQVLPKIARSAFLQTNSTPDCFQDLLSLFTNSGNPIGLSNFIMNSGKRINDLGNYPACKKVSTMRYILAGVNLDELFIRLGLCLPASCDSGYFDKFRGEIAEFATKVANFPIEPKNILFLDVAKENEIMKNYGSGFFAVIIITGILIIAGIISWIFEENEALFIKNSAVLSKIVKGFNIKNNINKFFEVRNPIDKNLDLFNGLRVISICWVVIGHSYESEVNTPTYNIDKMQKKLIHEWKYSFIKTGSLSVDLFFMIAGFFAAQTFYKLLRQNQDKPLKTILMSYLYRYIRLFPMLFSIVLIMSVVIPMIRDTPYNPYFTTQIENCKNYWYWTFLGVSNFQKLSNMCVDWTWYIMTDLQFFILAPFLILPFIHFSFKRGALAVGLVGLICTIITSCVHYHYELTNSLTKNSKNDYWTIYYIKPYCRIMPYLLGILAYFCYFDAKKKDGDAENNESIIKKLFTGWKKYGFIILGLIIMYFGMTTIYYLDNNPDSWGQGIATLYEVSFRPIFIIGLLLVIFPAILGEFNFLATFLGHPIFGVLAKLTYGVYMLNLAIIHVVLGFTLSGHYATDTWVLMNFFTILFISYLGSFFITVIFEIPVNNILQQFLARGKSDEKKIQITLEKSESLIEKIN